MLLKTVNFCGEKLKINTSAIVGLNYRKEFGKDLFTFFDKLKSNISNTEMDENEILNKFDFELLSEAISVAYIMIKSADNDKFENIEEFYSKFALMDLANASIELSLELFSTQQRLNNQDVGFRNKKKGNKQKGR